MIRFPSFVAVYFVQRSGRVHADTAVQPTVSF